METKIRLLPLRTAKTIAFKEEMQEAFQHVKVGVQSKGIGQAIWKAMSSVSILGESQKRMK